MGKPLPQCLRIVGFEVERFLVGAARFAGMTKVARYVAVRPTACLILASASSALPARNKAQARESTIYA